MDFVEQIRKKRNISKYRFAVELGRSPQAYQSLIQAKDRITFRDLINLRKKLGLSDSKLLDLIEKELKLGLLNTKATQRKSDG